MGRAIKKYSDLVRFAQIYSDLLRRDRHRPFVWSIDSHSQFSVTAEPCPTQPRLYIVGTSGGEIFHRAAILLKVFFVMSRREWPGQNPMWRRWLKMSDLLRLRMIWLARVFGIQALVLVGPSSS